MGGGPSVPSSTTQTQLMDPTRQAGLQKALNYGYKWADNYTGQSYPGQQVAGRTSDWYKAQRLAHGLANRFAEGGIAGVKHYADGGDTTNTTQQTNNADPGNPFLQAESDTSNATGALLDMAYQNWQPNQVSNTYTASTYTPGEITAPTMTGAAVNTNQISDAEAAKTLTANPDTWNAGFMKSYMDPYMQGVVDIAKREADRQYQQQLQQQKSQATASGAFGGYRQGVVEAEGARNQAQLLNDIQTKGQESAYTNAVNQFNADRAALMQTGQFNAQQASQIANSNLQARLSAESQRSSQAQAAETANQAARLTAAQANQQNALEGFKTSEAAKQNQANLALQAAQNNIANALANRQARAALLGQGLGGAAQLAGIESQYNTNNINTQNQLLNIDASARAVQQAQIDALMANWDKLQMADKTKAELLATLIGSMPGGSTSVKTTV